MSAGRTISIGGASTSRRDTWTFGLSIAVHVVVLGWGALTFAARPLTSEPTPMPIDIISVSEFTELTAGSRNAQKAQPAKPVAEQIGERKPPDDPAAKVAKTEVRAATDKAAELPEPKPPTPEKKQSEPTPEKKQSEPQRDLIAEAIKKDAAKPEPKKSEQKSEQKKAEPKPEKKVEAKAEPKTEPKTPPKKDQPKFDPRNVAALLDKRTPQRLAATGDAVSSNVGIGAPDASSNQLSLSEIDAFRRHLGKCWNPPAGAPTNKRVVVPITIRLKMDRTLAAQPEVEMRATDAYSLAMIESARRAIIACQPYMMFSLPKYETWKELSIDFDPEMFGG
jgi:outer membrane biosynthesis protein TonB